MYTQARGDLRRAYENLIGCMEIHANSFENLLDKGYMGFLEDSVNFDTLTCV